MKPPRRHEILADALPQSPYLRGNWADLDVPATVRVALRLLPDTRQVVLVLGSSQRELDAWSLVEHEVRSASPDREFIGLTGLTLEELRQWVRTLPEHSVVFMSGFMKDAKGRSLIPLPVKGDGVQLQQGEGGLRQGALDGRAEEARRGCAVRRGQQVPA